jgi:hypothetical protein
MTLKDYVRTSLVQIAEGVHEAQELVKAIGGVVSPAPEDTYGGNATPLRTDRGTVRTIRFDIATTVGDGVESKGEGGIFVSAIKLGGGRSSSQTNSSVSRLRFSVPIVLPSARIKS